MADTKPSWRKPELTVLVRSRTEEAVLAACKNAGVGASSLTVADRCWWDALGRCDHVCSDIAPS